MKRSSIAPWWVSPLFFGLAAFACQWVLVLVAIKGPFPDAPNSVSRLAHIPFLERLCQWDAVWYRVILERGYYTTMPPIAQAMNLANVAFFPGYPLAGRFFSQVFGLSSNRALLLVASLAAALFWFYVGCFLNRLSPAWKKLAICGCLVAYPAAFFVIAAYSESIFLASSLGLIFWSLQDNRAAAAWAAVHGFVMTATRLVGLPIALSVLAIGFIRVLARRPFAFRQLAAGVASLLGVSSFFGFCALKFGSWDLYMETQRIGWRIVPSYNALLQLETYRICEQRPCSEWDVLNRATVLPTLIILALVTLKAIAMPLFQLGKGWRAVGLTHAVKLLVGRLERQHTAISCLLLAGWASFLMAVAGLTSIRMQSMIRYDFVPLVFALLAYANLPRRERTDAQVYPSPLVMAWQRFTQAKAVRIFGCVALGVVIAICLATEVWLAWRFTQGMWVA